ncbi:MAG: THUMP domain-containing protein [Candidatus Nanohaloarchaea archaeon]|nr:THUMP domain-containing protein [Candidatus Nanohaloarchaea archaeon]
MLILVRYGEIGLKSSQVKAQFEQRLVERLEQKCSYAGIDGDVRRSEGRIFADVPEEDAADAAIALSRVPGVVSVSPAAQTSLDLDDIGEQALELVADQDAETFAVDARRAGEHDYTSADIEEAVGQRIVDGTGLEVDLDDPDVTVTVEARYTNAYLYTETVDGVGGLPVNEENRVAVLMEDRSSTVAAFLLMKRGCTVFPVYTGGDSERLETEMATLRQFDPDVKLTVMQGEEPAAALDRACDLYDCAAAAVARTADELGEEPAVAAELLLPTAGMSEEKVMERYRAIAAPSA